VRINAMRSSVCGCSMGYLSPMAAACMFTSGNAGSTACCCCCCDAAPAMMVSVAGPSTCSDERTAMSEQTPPLSQSAHMSAHAVSDATTPGSVAPTSEMQTAADG